MVNLTYWIPSINISRDGVSATSLSSPIQRLRNNIKSFSKNWDNANSSSFTVTADVHNEYLADWKLRGHSQVKRNARIQQKGRNKENSYSICIDIYSICYSICSCFFFFSPWKRCNESCQSSVNKLALAFLSHSLDMSYLMPLTHQRFKNVSAAAVFVIRKKWSQMTHFISREDRVPSDV